MTSLQQRAQSPSLSRGVIVIRLIERRWLIGACLVLGWVIGTTVGRILPRKYRSETVILIEQQKVPTSLVEPNIAVDLQQQRLQSITEQMLSRTGLLALIEKFHLYGGQVNYRDPDALAERMRKDIKIELIGAEGKRQLSAFQVSYSAPSPIIAREVTNELASRFINETLQDRKQLSEDTTSFLQTELDEARQSLAEQEEKLREFRTESSGDLPEQLQSNLQILAGLQNQLQDSTDALSHAQQHDIYLRSLYHQYQSSGATTASGLNVAHPLETQLNILRAQLAELESRYTDSYPEVIAVKQEISKLEAQQVRTASMRVSDPVTPNARDANIPPITSQDSAPMIQLSGELSANDLQIKSEKAKVQSLEKQIEIYQSRLNSAPAREEKAAAVNRDYDQSRTYYEALLNKKLQSEMATELEKRRQGEQFRMIDPANLPSRAYSPNQLVCSLAGLAGGLAVGLAIALLLGVLNARIYQAPELAEFIGFGYVLPLPVMATEQELALAHRRRVLEGTAAVVLAAVIPAITILDYYKS
jgi:succinoglycan biosynthesis transport protein ExoP